MTHDSLGLESAVLLGSFFAVGILTTTLPSALPEILHFYTLPASQARMLFAAWGAGMILGAAIGLARQAGRSVRTTFAGSLVLLAILSYVISQPLGLTWFVVLLVGGGSASGVMVTLGHQCISSKEHLHRNRMLGMSEASLSLGAVATPLLIDALLSAPSGDTAIWSSSYTAAAILCSLLFVVVAMRGNVLAGERENEADLPRLDVSSRLSPRQPAAIYILSGFCAMAFAAFSIEYSYAYWIATYTASFPGVGTDTGRNALLVFLVGMVVSRSLLVTLSTPRQLCTLVTAAAALLVSLFLYLPSYHRIDGLLTATFIVGLAVGVLYPALLAIFMYHFTHYGAKLSFLGMLVGTIGAKSSAALSGVVIEAYGFAALFIALASMTAILAVTFFMYLDSLTILAEEVRS